MVGNLPGFKCRAIPLAITHRETGGLLAVLHRDPGAIVEPPYRLSRVKRRRKRGKLIPAQARGSTLRLAHGLTQLRRQSPGLGQGPLRGSGSFSPATGQGNTRSTPGG
jgi:hypothetical protein